MPVSRSRFRAWAAVEQGPCHGMRHAITFRDCESAANQTEVCNIMDLEDLVLLRRYPTRMQAEWARTHLAEAGITAMLVVCNYAAVDGGEADAAVGYDLTVPSAVALEAAVILESEQRLPFAIVDEW